MRARRTACGAVAGPSYRSVLLSEEAVESTYLTRGIEVAFVPRRHRHISTGLFHRLEQLRFLGFLERVPDGEVDGIKRFGWKISEKYQQELGL